MFTIGVKHGFGRYIWYPSQVGPPTATRTTALAVGFRLGGEYIFQSDVSIVIMYDYLTQAFGLAASCMGRVSLIFYVLRLTMDGTIV